jgi:hypothetical protein
MVASCASVGRPPGDLQKVGDVIMAEQKKEAREGLADATIVVNSLEKIYLMEVTRLSPADVEAFRDKTRFVYDKWAEDIGVEMVRSAETIVKLLAPSPSNQINLAR